MSKTAHVVDGEASESESEVEVGKSPEAEASSSKLFVVAGEAPESDDESKISSPKTPEPVKLPVKQRRNLMKTNYNSLLHQKLWECNVSLRATVEGLLRHTVDISVEKLCSADKMLLNVQESMRATNTSLTLARARLKQIHTELENANCSSAFPTVVIKQ